MTEPQTPKGPYPPHSEFQHRGMWIKAIRLTLEETQGTTGEKLGITASLIRKIESGEVKANTILLRKFCEAYDIPHDQRPTEALEQPKPSLNPDDYKSRGAWIRALRIDAGDSQQKLGEKTSQSHTQIYKYESGKVAPPDLFLSQFCDIYSVPESLWPEELKKKKTLNARDYETPGSWVRSIRLHFGDSQSALRVKSGYSKEYIVSCETGVGIPSIRFLQKIIEVYDLNYDVFPEIAPEKNVPVSQNPSEHRSLAVWMRAVRLGAGDDVTVFSKKMNVPVTLVRKVEIGKWAPTAMYMHKFCRVYNIPKESWPVAAREISIPDFRDFHFAGEWARAIRLHFGDTVSQLAVRTGIDRKKIAAYESGALEMSRKFIELILNTYELPKQDLLRHEPAEVSYNPNDYRSRGLWMRAVRLDHRDSEEELATKLGVPIRVIHRSESNYLAMAPRHIEKFCDIYNIAEYAPDAIGIAPSASRNPALYQSLSTWIRVLRADAGDSLIDAATRFDTPSIILSAFERGRKPAPAFLRKLCQAYNIPAEWWPEVIRQNSVPSRHYFDSDGEWIRAIQFEFGEQRSYMAKKLGIPLGALARYEKHRAVPELALQTICDVYKLSEDMYPKSLRCADPLPPFSKYPAGVWIRALRQHFKDSPAGLASKLGLTEARLHMYENGERALAPGVLRTICHVYAVPKGDWPESADKRIPLPHDYSSAREWICAVRHYYGESQLEFSAKIQSEMEDYCRYEQGRLEIPSTVFLDVFDACGIPTQYLSSPHTSGRIPTLGDHPTENSWIRALRLHNRQMRDELGSLIGVSAKYMSTLEKDGTPIPRDILADICREYAVHEDQWPRRLRLSPPMPMQYANRHEWLKELQIFFGEPLSVMARKIGLDGLQHYVSADRAISLDIVRALWNAYKLPVPFSIENLKGESVPTPARFASLNQWLRAVRFYYEVSQKDVATGCAMAAVSLQRYESGSLVPKILFLRRFRDYFDLSNQILTDALVQFYQADKESDQIFWDLTDTRVGSSEERAICNRIAVKFMPIAKAVGSMSFGRFDREDLTQTAAIALSRVSLFFVPGSDEKFRRFAKSWCRGAALSMMLKEYYEGLSWREISNIREVRHTISNFMAETGRAPLIREIVERCSLDLDAVERCRVFMAQRDRKSLDQLTSDGSRTIESTIGSTPDEFSLVEMRATLSEIFSDNPQAAVLVMRTLVEHEELSVIANDLGLEESQASEILEGAVQLLRGRWEPAEENEVEAPPPVRSQAPPPTPRRYRPRPPLH